MFDWYILLTPLFALFIFVVLITVKMALRRQKKNDIITLSKAKQKKNRSQEFMQEGIFITSPVLRTFAYFIRNHTFLEMCLRRKSKNKLPLLLTISAISALSLIHPTLYAFSFLGLPIVLIFVIAQSYFEIDPLNPLSNSDFNLNHVKESAFQQQKMQQNNQKLYIIYAILSCAIALFTCGLIYKNYANSALSALLLNILVNSSLDQFLIRPLSFLVISIPLKFSLRIQIHIDHDNLREQFENQENLENVWVQNCAIGLSPRKKKCNSPTKIPKALLNNENQNIAFENVKKIKKQKKYDKQILRNSRKNNKIYDNLILEEYSLNNFFEYEKSVQQTPINNAKFDFIEENAKNQGSKTKRKDSELVIVQFKNRDDEEEQEVQQQDQLSPQKQNFIHSNLDLNDISQYQSNKDQQLENQNPINLIKIQGEDDHNKKDSFRTLQYPVRPLQCVNQEEDKRQIDEIDLNSPERRGRNLNELIKDGSRFESSAGRRRKGTHYKGNSKKRQIKFTTGQPYLEYLPKMLNNERLNMGKRSQPICYKNDISIVENIERSSMKRIKNKRNKIQGNENECPDALEIQDL